MKKAITLLLITFSFYCKAQLYNGAAGGIQNNGQNTYFTLPVSGLTPANIDSTFGVEQVTVNINHPDIQELFMYLESPSGTVVELSEGTSCSGANYTNTCFDSRASTSVTLSAAPYTGTFRPIGYLGRFNTGQSGNGNWTLIVKDVLAFVDSGSVVSWSIQFGNTPPAPVVFTSSNLPIVIINTHNQYIGDTAVMADMGIIYNGAGQRNYTNNTQNNYLGKIMMNIRGNSTRYFEKKSWSLKTCDASQNSLDVSILGMPAEHDWDMVAPYQDKSLIRNPLGYDLFREMGHYSSRYVNVEVVVDGEYRGVYLFMEAIKRNKNRVNVAKLSTTDNAMPAVSGGYIIKVDRNDGPGWYSALPGNFSGNKHFYYAYDYPKSKDMTVQQKTYIQTAMDTFETVMNSPYFADPVRGYPKKIDPLSFVDYLLISELSKNPDAYRISSYLYKDNDVFNSTIHAGPAWDFGIGWHNCNYGDAFDTANWQYTLQDTVYPTPTWWNRFTQDTNFVNNMYCRWEQLRGGLFNVKNLDNYIDSSAAVLSESEVRNFKQWPIIGTYIWPDPQNQATATYSSEVADVKKWVSGRIAWMDRMINGICKSPLGVPAYSTDNLFATYPNPFSSQLTTRYHINTNSLVRIDLINVLGVQVSSVINSMQSPGDYTRDIDTGDLSSGIYTIRLQINDQIADQKLVKVGFN